MPSRIPQFNFSNKAASLASRNYHTAMGRHMAISTTMVMKDLVVNNINSKCFIYRNDANVIRNNHYLKIRFAGTDKNRFGIGAEVKLKMKDSIQVLQNF
jgi:hypothetical protein